MAAMMTAAPVLPVRAARTVAPKASKPVALRSAFTGSKARLAVRPAAARSAAVSKKVTTMAFDGDWLKKDPLVFVLGFLGWTVPSAMGVSAFGGNSLFGLFMASIGENMARFPTGPALDDKFYLYLLTWHIGLFTTMILGQVGVQGKKQGYW